MESFVAVMVVTVCAIAAWIFMGYLIFWIMEYSEK
jgi:hypothetical protein|tara:strand:+ start:532 stop:636 length:105 start_codon:yes stop_codon:yes gene_type:complete